MNFVVLIAQVSLMDNGEVSVSYEEEFVTRCRFLGEYRGFGKSIVHYTQHGQLCLDLNDRI
jgi:hypothetical protein